LPNESTWFNKENEIFLWESGVLRNIITGEYLRLRPFDDTQRTASSSDGLETILIREFTSLQGHKLRRVEANDFLTDVESSEGSENYLYPNPTSGTINISLSNKYASHFEYEIISTAGQIALSGVLGIVDSESTNININISSVPIEQYTIRIYSDREEFTYNFIKVD